MSAGPAGVPESGVLEPVGVVVGVVVAVLDGEGDAGEVASSEQANSETQRDAARKWPTLR
jgi:hypothetical protein